MIDKLKVTPLVSPAEAVRLAKLRTIEDIYIALDIAKAVDKSPMVICEPAEWRYLFSIATVWNAGRIQGIREERARRKRQQNANLYANLNISKHSEVDKG